MGVPTIRVFSGAKKGAVSANDTKTRFANGESTRLATPGCTLGSRIARLTPKRNAASTRGGLVYPPRPIARSGRRRRQIAKHSSRPTGTPARPCRAPHTPRPITPCAVIVINSNPSRGTTFVSSPRTVPTKMASLPGSTRANSRASATPGYRWPPVPPAAIITRILRTLNRGAGPGDRHEEPRPDHADDQRRPSVTQERQRQSLGGQQTRDHPHIDQRVEPDQQTYSQGHMAREGVVRFQRDRKALRHERPQ